MDPNQRGRGRGRVRLVEPSDPSNYAQSPPIAQSDITSAEEESTVELLPAAQQQTASARDTKKKGKRANRYNNMRFDPGRLKKGVAKSIAGEYRSDFYDPFIIINKRRPNMVGKAGRQINVILNNFQVRMLGSLPTIYVYAVKFYYYPMGPNQELKQIETPREGATLRSERATMFWQVGQNTKFYGTANPARLVYDDMHMLYSPTDIKPPLDERTKTYLFVGEVNCLGLNGRKNIGVSIVKKLENALAGDFCDIPSESDVMKMSEEQRNGIVSKKKKESTGERGASNLMQFYNLLITAPHRCPIHAMFKHFTQSGPSIYYRNLFHVSLGNGREVWRGFQCIFRPTGQDWTLSVTINTAFKAFVRNMKLLDWVAEIMNQFCREAWTPNKAISELQWEILKKEMKNIVVTTIPAKPSEEPRTIKVFTLSRITDTANTRKFSRKKDSQGNKLETPEELTVAQYFAETGRTLRFPHLPLVMSGSKKREVSLPMEWLRIDVPQKAKISQSQRDKEMLTRQMIKTAAQRPQEKKKSIDSDRKNAIGDHEFMKEFGMQISTEMSQVKARELQPPKIKYANKTVDVRDGVWRTDGCKFIKPAKINAVYIINFARQTNQPEVVNFYVALKNKCRDFGMTFPEEPEVNVDLSEYNSEEQIRDQINKTFLQIRRDAYDKFPELMEGLGDYNIRGPYEMNSVHAMPLVFCILPGRDNKYAHIKFCSECVSDTCLMTQCVQHATLKKFADERGGALVATNFAFKLNLKMGGINHELEHTSGVWKHTTEHAKEMTLILGVDVIHPTRGEATTRFSNDVMQLPVDELGMPVQRSYASVVGNIDQKCTTWVPMIKMQKPDKEHVVYMYDCVRSNLAHMQKAKKKVTRIIIYRDGIDDGAFLPVLRKEMSACRSACEFSGLNNVKITFIVSRKKNTTRIMPVLGGGGKTGNVQPGTVVEEGLSHPIMFDFYLVSQFGLQGTSVPTHYSVIQDDSDMSPDQIQELTFILCHQFARCSRSVKMPAPVYYADISAARAMEHHKGANWDKIMESVTVRSESNATVEDGNAEDQMPHLLPKERHDEDRYSIGAPELGPSPLPPTSRAPSRISLDGGMASGSKGKVSPAAQANNQFDQPLPHTHRGKLDSDVDSKMRSLSLEDSQRARGASMHSEGRHGIRGSQAECETSAQNLAQQTTDSEQSGDSAAHGDRVAR